ncbi:MAG: phosphoglycerate mutase family protein [Verrucomicrobia bacterium]|nr:phosphoglycerate mutase family protein [Verrucomicrobiota bacterium]
MKADLNKKKLIRFLRHAQSAANAGFQTSDPSEIPLTTEGKAAAENAAIEYDGPAPELIVVSPFLRAKQTAGPFIARFPLAKVETTLPVQEFTYISPERCVETTFAERRPMVENYWRHAAPDYVDGPRAESFEGFIARVKDSITKLLAREEKSILVICHEMFIQAAEFYQQPTENPTNPDSMRGFHHFTLDFPVKNLGFWDFTDFRDWKCHSVARYGSRKEAGE